MTCVLALDLAKNRSGWAVLGEAWEKPIAGVWETVKWEDNEAQNLHVFRKFLTSLGDTYSLTHVIIEQVFIDLRNGGKAFQWVGTQGQLFLSGVALEWAASRGLKVFQASPSDWRQRFLGLSRKPKDSATDKTYWKNLALKVAAQRGLFCEFHDAAEAYGIADYALAALSKPYRLRTDKFLARQHQDIDLKMGAHA